MKVTLMRQWAVTPSSAKRTVHNVEISEAKSRPLPPSIDSEEPGMDGGTATIDWDGEIPLERAAVGETGSFDAGHLLAEVSIAIGSLRALGWCTKPVSRVGLCFGVVPT